YRWSPPGRGPPSTTGGGPAWRLVWPSPHRGPRPGHLLARARASPAGRVPDRGTELRLSLYRFSVPLLLKGHGLEEALGLLQRGCLLAPRLLLQRSDGRRTRRVASSTR